MKILLTVKRHPYSEQMLAADIVINVTTGEVMKSRNTTLSDIHVVFDDPQDRMPRNYGVATGKRDQ